MSNAVKESGYYALAGFLYQLLGSVVEAWKICDQQEDGDALSELLILEWFGEDAYVPATDRRKQKLIQYKYTSTNNAVMLPHQVREILQGFLRSLNAQGLTPKQADYELVTNLKRHADWETWKNSKSHSELKKFIQYTSKSEEIANTSELATIFRRLHRTDTTIDDLRLKIDEGSRQFGVLETEVPDRVDQLVGMLMGKFQPNSPDRIIRKREILKALAGFEDPYELLGRESVQIRLDDVEKYRRGETSFQKCIIPRIVSEDIARAVLEYPFIVVHGDGGCGKSVALSDAILAGLRDFSGPPGFGLVMPANDTNEIELIRRIARWRHQKLQCDQEFEITMSRLRRSFRGDPLLVVCIDAIDEKGGEPTLPGAVQSCIRELIDRAVTSFEEHGVPTISVVLACRRENEYEKLDRGRPLPVPHPISVSEFDDSELRKLVQNLSGSVEKRIVSHLDVRSESMQGRVHRGARAVPPNVMNALRHPVIWGFFSDQSEVVQQECLNGTLDLLAAAYFQWFRRKADIRIPGLGDECECALRAVACAFPRDASQIGEKQQHWLSPCRTMNGDDIRLAKQLMKEAMTAGIVIDVENEGHKWRWKHTWLCEYLRKEDP